MDYGEDQDGIRPSSGGVTEVIKLFTPQPAKLIPQTSTLEKHRWHWKHFTSKKCI